MSALVAGVLLIAPATRAAAGEEPQSVVVKAGDTLWGLARRNGTTVADLQRLDHLGTSTLIRIGQTLVLRDGRAEKVATAIAYARAQVVAYVRLTDL